MRQRRRISARHSPVHGTGLFALQPFGQVSASLSTREKSPAGDVRPRVSDRTRGTHLFSAFRTDGSSKVAGAATALGF